MNINNLLNEEIIKISDLLIDPNNPRFCRNHDEITPVEKIDDEAVQEDAYRRMTDSKNHFDIDVLVASIQLDGFIHVDKIFVKKINKKYLVLEGNRRITAIKKLLKNSKNHIKGYEISDEILKQITKLPCIVVDDKEVDFEEQIQKILGLRHHGSILPWKPLPAAFNLYQKYMLEYCSKNNTDPTDPNNFVYEPSIAKKVGDVFSVKWTDVRDRVKLYRVYEQLLEVSNKHPDVESPESFSMIEETLGRPTLRKYFGYDDNKSIFSEDGVEKILDIYFGLRGKSPVITGASVGSSNIRDFYYVIENGAEGDVHRIFEEREEASKIKAEIMTKSSHESLQNTLSLVLQKLEQIELGDIKDGFAPNEKDYINRIDKKILQLKRAAEIKN